MNDARVCDTPGCYETAYGSSLCDLCLDGRTPDKRGAVTIREALYARAYRQPDQGVTRARLVAHNQPTDILEPGEPPVQFDTRRPSPDGQTILRVTSAVDAKLIEHFHR